MRAQQSWSAHAWFIFISQLRASDCVHSPRIVAERAYQRAVRETDSSCLRIFSVYAYSYGTGCRESSKKITHTAGPSRDSVSRGIKCDWHKKVHVAGAPAVIGALSDFCESHTHARTRPVLAYALQATVHCYYYLYNTNFKLTWLFKLLGRFHRICGKEKGCAVILYRDQNFRIPRIDLYIWDRDPWTMVEIYRKIS